MIDAHFLRSRPLFTGGYFRFKKRGDVQRQRQRDTEWSNVTTMSAAASSSWNARILWKLFHRENEKHREKDSASME